MAAIDTSSNPFSALGLGATETQKKDQGQIGLEEFLKLMTTQLNNQDPFEPMDNGQFLGQIAQFGTVSGIEQLNDSFAGFSSSITNGQALQAGSLVGREVLAPIDAGSLQAGSSIRGRVELDSSANNVVLRVTDEYGQLVREMDLGGHGSGPLEFSWDGINDAGDYANPGVYRLQVEAQRAGSNELLATQLYANVDSVNLGAGGAGLTLNLSGLGSIDFDQVSAIH